MGGFRRGVPGGGGGVWGCWFLERRAKLEMPVRGGHSNPVTSQSIALVISGEEGVDEVISFTRDQTKHRLEAFSEANSCGKTRLWGTDAGGKGSERSRNLM